MSDFNEEIKIIDEIYSDLVEAIMNKPEVEDYEKSRLYFENVASRMNYWVSELKQVKNLLESREPLEDLTADNRPA